MEFKEKLNNLMIREKLTVTELADRTGINKSLISRYLSGQRIPKRDKIVMLSEALHEPVGYLMDVEDTGVKIPDLLINTDDNTKHVMISYSELSPAKKEEVARFIEFLKSKDEKSEAPK